MRWIGGAIALLGLAGSAYWAATAGARPQSVAGSFDIPIACLGLLIAGLFVWMAGMARHDRAQDPEWRKLYSPQAIGAPPAPEPDTGF